MHYYIYIYIFWVVVSLEGFFFVHGLTKYELLLKRSIWPIEGTLTFTSNSGQSRARRNDNKRILHRFLELEPHYQMQFDVIPRKPPFWESYPSEDDTVGIF